MGRSAKTDFVGYLGYRIAQYARASIIAWLSLGVLLPLAQADNDEDTKHRLVIQVSSADAQSHDSALRNA